MITNGEFYEHVEQGLWCRWNCWSTYPWRGWKKQIQLKEAEIQSGFFQKVSPQRCVYSILIGRREFQKLLLDTQSHLKCAVTVRCMLLLTWVELRCFITVIVYRKKRGGLLTECVKSTHDIKPVEKTDQRKGALSDERWANSAVCVWRTGSYTVYPSCRTGIGDSIAGWAGQQPVPLRSYSFQQNVLGGPW